MRKLKLFFACLLVTLFSIGQLWADVESGTAYTTTSGSFPTGWSKHSGNEQSKYIGLYSGDYIQTENFCQNGFTSIVVSARKLNGPSDDEKVLTIEWIPEDGSDAVVLGTVSPGGTSLANLTLSDFSSTPTANTSGSIKLSCKAAPSAKGDGVGAVTINYTAGTCGSGTPTCATPTFNPAAGSYEGTQNVTISSTTGATIYYTTDGSNPTTSGTKQTYSDPIVVSADMTIKAYAVKDSYNDSEVATAEYTITEGPDVTLNLIDGNWGFPTSNTTEDGTYTNSVTGYSVTCHAPTNYKVNGSDYFFIGKSGAYILLPEFTSPIEKIVVSGNSGGAADVAWNIYQGETAVSTAASGCKNDAYTFDIAPANQKANVAHAIKVTNAKNLQIKVIKIYFGEAAAVEAPTISGETNFVTSTTVTITQADADAIYYTTDDSDPKTSGTKQTYSAPFTVNGDGTTTVKAYAVKGSDESAVASKTFTKVEALESLAALLEATVSDETAFNVVVDNWVVTGVNGSRAWIADAANEKGILLYKSSHGFVAGNKLNGVVLGTKSKLYQGYPELTTLVSTDVTVTTAEAITPRTTTIAALTSGYNAEQGTVVKLENLTYAVASTSFSDGENTIQADNKLYSASLVDGATYNLTGVVEYENNSVIKIMPRSADDVEQVSGGGLPEVTGLAALKAEATGASYLVTLTDAIVTLVDGNNAFIEDANAGALIYFSGHGLAAGDKLNGQYEVTTATYNGKFEITAMTAQDGAETTHNAEIPVTTLTIAQLNANFAANESRRIKIVGANVTDAIGSGDRNGEISDGENTVILYAGKSGVAAALNDNIDAIGYPTFYVTNTADQRQLAVWAQADITVNEKDPAGIAFDPESVTITAGDAWTKPDFANPNNLDVDFSSNNESVATVSNTGIVALEGGYGTAVITAHTDGDATHSAGNATYTITVNDPSAAPAYTMSFDLTRASYDDAADAQVVWNSSVLTMTADKNDGTKVTNYLAGYYTGTTLITETRFYAKNSISFVPQSGVTITKIEWMSTAKGYATKLAAETFVNATAAVDGTDDKLVIITPSAAGEISVTLTDAARATAVTVYYEAESEKAKLAASIDIANINMAVGDDDILLSDVAATSNPNKKAISYAVTSGSEYVSITGEGPAAAFHALAEGTATVTATIPNDFGNYTGATTTFNIVVAAAPATLESIAISGTASVLEYTEGQDFNPAGLVVTGHYSDNSDAVITDGITWAFDPSPLTEGTTSVSVTATVNAIASDVFVVNGLTVSAAAAPEVKNVVILATYNTKVYAMTNSLSSGALAAVEVEKDGSNIVVASAEDKVAIQWTATESAGNTTLMDGNNKYIKGSDGASLSLDDAAYNWTWDGEKSCYISSAYSTRGLFFNNSGVFKGYATSNLSNPAYAAIEVMEIAAENIVITSKVSAELAYNPASDEITQGDAWSAPELVNPHSVTITSYASDNESVATVTDGGVIALAGGIGTAVITAHFAGDASYLEGDAEYTITVNAVPEPAEDCDGTDDFLDTEDKGNPTSYKERSTPNGWTAVNAGYKVIEEKAYWMINGKTTAVGVITSPELSNGIASLKFRYANTNSESNGVSVKIEIKQGGDVVKEYTLTKPNSEVVQNTVYTELIENINVAGTFQIVITNLCPSNNTGNKDRVSIGRFCWSSYSAAPEPPTQDYTEVRTGLEEGRHYTVCLENNVTAVKGATFWSLRYKNAANTVAYLEEETAPLAAGKPYIFQATAATLEVIYGEESAAAGTNGALVGTFSNLDADALNAINVGDNKVYMLFQNELRPIGTNNHLDANRAYVLYNLLEIAPSPNFAPGKNVKAMPLHGDAATGMDQITNDPSAITNKVIIDGRLYILRGEKLYDATGRLVK